MLSPTQRLSLGLEQHERVYFGKHPAMILMCTQMRWASRWSLSHLWNPGLSGHAQLHELLQILPAGGEACRGQNVQKAGQEPTPASP